jgi:hypothetical protein
MKWFWDVLNPGKLRKPLQFMGLRSYAQPVALALVLAGSTLLAGCSHPYAAQTNHPLTPEEACRKPVLSQTDQQQIGRGFQTLIEPGTAGGPRCEPAALAKKPRLRWSDIPQAVDLACSDNQTAITRTTRTADGYQFELKTINDHRGRLTIYPTGDETLYRCQITLGLFDDQGQLKDALFESIRQHLQTLARKRSLDDLTTR